MKQKARESVEGMVFEVVFFGRGWQNGGGIVCGATWKMALRLDF